MSTTSEPTPGEAIMSLRPPSKVPPQQGHNPQPARTPKARPLLTPRSKQPPEQLPHRVGTFGTYWVAAAAYAKMPR